MSRSATLRNTNKKNPKTTAPHVAADTNAHTPRPVVVQRKCEHAVDVPPEAPERFDAAPSGWLQELVVESANDHLNNYNYISNVFLNTFTQSNYK